MYSGIYAPRWVRMRCNGGSLSVVTFVADRTCRFYAGALAEEEQARVLATAVGETGPNIEYLRYLSKSLGDFGLNDRRIERLHAMVEQFMTAANSDMPACALTDLPGSLTRGSRLLGIDQGEKTLGLAISDSRLRVASPLMTIKRKKFTKDAEALAGVCAAEEVGGLVLGLPVNMDGSEGPRCQSVRQFAANLEEIAGFDLPYAFWDERLSSAAVERALIGEADMNRKRRGQVIDKMAAAYILQGALDALAYEARRG